MNLEFLVVLNFSKNCKLTVEHIHRYLFQELSPKEIN